jgi:short-subunit dehydrogenase
MNNKVVLVTGASSGLGKSIAKYLSERGFKVYGTSRSVQQDFEGVTMLQMDVTKKNEVELSISSILEIEKRIDVLINNAGIGMVVPLEESDSMDFSSVINTNLIGPFETIKAILPQMRKQGSGIIINISSIASRVGLPFRSAYCASKSGLDGLTEALRMEVKAWGIKVCSVQPGDIRTNINDHRIMYAKKDSAYKSSFGRCSQIINNDVLVALEPDYFAERIFRIIRSKKIKRAYVLGRPMQKLTILLRNILPDSLFERIIMGYYKTLEKRKN